jgi:hypothetical protein
VRPPSPSSLCPMARRTVVGIVLTAVAAGGCLHAGDNQAGDAGQSASGRVRVDSVRALNAAYVSGNRLYGFPDGQAEPRRLAGAVNTTLFAMLSPAAVPDHGRRRLVYNSWRGRRPLLRLHDPDGGDVVIAQGAYSAAWRRDGALAYFEALKADLPSLQAIKRYVGHVVVRRSPRAKPVRWTRAAGRYVVAAWARDRLLVYRLTTSWPDLLVLDRPGRLRTLAKAGALVALSPDGRRAFVATYGTSPAALRVLTIADGRERARASFRRLRWVVESGSWGRDRVVAATSAGIAAFRVAETKIALEQVLALDARFSAALAEPQSDASGERVVTSAELESRPRQALPSAVVVECNLAERRCAAGPEVASVARPRLVYNPSRP